jgi:hypothetical protein
LTPSKMIQIYRLFGKTCCFNFQSIRVNHAAKIRVIRIFGEGEKSWSRKRTNGKLQLARGEANSHRKRPGEKNCVQVKKR